jgi:hypothetical protein
VADISRPRPPGAPAAGNPATNLIINQYNQNAIGNKQIDEIIL